jgi:hypothetical protein
MVPRLLPSYYNVPQLCTTMYRNTYYSVPQRIESVSVTDEKNLIELFIQEVNSNFMAELATECTLDRELDSEHKEVDSEHVKGKRFVLVGASNVARLACAM